MAVSARPGIDALLERIREGFERVGPREAYEAAGDGALLVDIRYQALRERDGLIPGAVVVERNELEWRLDPTGSHRLAEVSGPGLRVVVICNEGYASSLAAESLHRLGLHRATDLTGGFQAWRAAGLPVAGWTPETGAPALPAVHREHSAPPATGTPGRD
ncbi:rhodanese-like domain-containing protein [Streptomyces zhihengii]|uniref:rhodanese-like domain-containing protein n=1 Tax=Streptomyces zhihengii TaxID=1818004 RepID=UPI00355799E2